MLQQACMFFLKCSLLGTENFPQHLAQEKKINMTRNVPFVRLSAHSQGDNVMMRIVMFSSLQLSSHETERN